MKKTFNIGKVSMKMHSNGFPAGLVLKRSLTIRECKHIMKDLLGIDIRSKDDCEDSEEYNEFNEELKSNVNNWLNGECDDNVIMEYAYDCSDDPIGIFNLIPIISYLQKRKLYKIK